jgi:phage baseplate assembly protein W
MAVASKLKPISYTYIDVNSSYGQGAALLVADIDAVNGQIFNILRTLLGECDYEPLLGAKLDNYLFDPNTRVTAEEVSMLLHDAITRWLSSRIRLSPNGFAVRRDVDNRLLLVSLSYTYINLGVSVSATFAVSTPA